MLASIVLLDFFLGSKKRPSGIGVKCGSAWFYIIQASLILECAGVTIFAIRMAIEESRIKHKFNINVAPNDFKYEKKGIAMLMIVGVAGGFIQGGFGVGGSVVYSPALLALGYDAQVSNSTGMFMAMISNIAGIIS